MSNEYNGMCYGGFGAGIELIVLMLFFAMGFGNNGNGGFFGNNGNTAAETAALVQQDNLRSLAANTNATLGWNQQLLGGAVQALERIGDKADRNLANTQQRIQALQQQNSDLKTLLATNQARCEREADTRTILNAIANNNCNRGGCGQVYPAMYGNGCYPFGSEYQNAVIAGLTGINQGISGLQASQAAQTTTLNAIQTRVNQIPTTAAAA